MVPELLAAVALSSLQAAPALTWDNLPARMEAAEKEGFSGAALLVHDGKVVLDQGYGLANREEKIRGTKDTVFAIGSTPIDFTKAAILLLAEREKLKLDEALPAFFADVPEKKRGITVEHLMTGRSGLRDFHDVPGDANPDHTWIDRAEAVKRIFAQELLFEPGKGHEHSHSAFGLLAAIVEIRSERSYQEFTRKELFEPAGMKDTGFFGEPIAKERLAVGYGERKHGEVNAPPSWGKTSWLVMGSGGMVSTSGDLLRWNRALREGRLLSKASLERYWAPPGAVLDGGDMFGFEIQYTEGPGSQMILMSNSVDESTRERFEALANELFALVSGRTLGRFSLGVKIRLEQSPTETKAIVDEVVPGSAAERDGLRAGDRLLAVGGERVTGDPLAQLSPYLADGKTVRFTVERDGKQIDVSVKPNPR